MRKLTSLRFTATAGLAALLAVPLAAIVRGPDAGGYIATDATVSSFVDVSGAGGAAVLAGTDDGVAALTLPFSFSFYNHSYSLVCVSSNAERLARAVPVLVGFDVPGARRRRGVLPDGRRAGEPALRGPVEQRAAD
jgi:hypothetical protein